MSRLKKALTLCHLAFPVFKVSSFASLDANAEGWTPTKQKTWKWGHRSQGVYFLNQAASTAAAVKVLKYSVPRSRSAPFLERRFEINLSKLAASLHALAANPACVAVAASHFKAAFNLSSPDKVKAFVTQMTSTVGIISFNVANPPQPKPKALAAKTSVSATPQRQRCILDVPLEQNEKVVSAEKTTQTDY